MVNELIDIRPRHIEARQVYSDTRIANVWIMDGYLIDILCDALCPLIDAHLRPSTITHGPADFRTSQTADLGIHDGYMAVEQLDALICYTMGIPSDYGEPLQGQRYDVGQQFKPHTDYFEPGTAEYAAHAAQRGQRTWTFMVYLNDVERGGETRFTDLGLSVDPRKGTALAWANLNMDGSVNPRTIHAGMPVLAGRKYVITKWFRERAA